METLRNAYRKYAHVFVEPLKKVISKIRRLDTYDLAVLTSILAYGLIFSFFTILKHNIFLTFAWDLGIFDQALYSTIQGNLLHYTTELYMVPSGCYFAAHFSPILFVILPFYAIRPSSETLLVIGSFALAIGAAPLYLSVCRVLGSKKTGLFFVILYLLYPALQGANWFDFHTQRFLPLFLFSGYYFAVTKRWKLYLLSMLFALMVEEHVPIIVFLMTLYFLIGSSKNLVKSIRHFEMDRTKILLIGTMIVSVLWFFFAQYVKGTFFIDPQFLVRFRASGAFSVLGIETDPLLLPVYIVLNPQGVLSALMYDYPSKLFFLVMLFSPLLFLPLRSRYSVIPLFLLIPSFLSNYLAYYTIGAQYPLFIIPLIFIALIIAMEGLHASVRIPLLKIALVVAVIFALSLSPISPLSQTFAQKQVIWYPMVSYSPNENLESLHKLIDLIPPNASVLTQNHVFPHLSTRLEAYVIPPIGRFLNDTTYIQTLVNRSEYILLDLAEWDFFTEYTYDIATGGGAHRLYALGSKCLLLQKDYQGEPLFKGLTEARVFFAHEDLTISSRGEIVQDPTAETGQAIFCEKNASGIVVYGPFIYLLEGTYEVTFTVKLGEHGDEYAGTVDISEAFGETVLSRRDMYGFEFQSNTWTNFTLEFSSTKLRRNIEFRMFASGLTDIYIDKVYLKRTSPSAESDFGSQTLAPGSINLTPGKHLRTDTGNITEEGFFIHYRNSSDDFFWYGPYWSLSPGNYTLTFYLKISPKPLVPDEKVITVQVSADTGSTTVAEYEVYASDFVSDQGSTWQGFTVAFELEEPMKQIEFRGLGPSPSYDIYLALVLFNRTS